MLLCTLHESGCFQGFGKRSQVNGNMADRSVLAHAMTLGTLTDVT